MAAAALALYLVFMLVVFAMRVWLHYRRTGDYGIRLRPPDGTARVAGLLLLVGIVLGGTAPVAELVGMAPPLPSFDITWIRGAGLALSLLGMAIVVVSQSQMGDAWRVGVDPRETTELITRGPFSAVRNPIFTGVITGAAGLLLAVPNALSALALFAVVAGLELHVRAVEEPYLIRVHGERYLSYGRAVGRFLPGVGRFAR